jgi:predicted ATPase/transcriptional regulator with XRE-family HTH domain
MSTDLSFSSWLRQRRARLGITQNELSDQLGFSSAMLRKIESGERRPSGQIAVALATYFLIPTDEQEAFVAFARSGQTSIGEGSTSTAETSVLHPWRSAYVRRTNLPAALTPLIGRENEQAAAHNNLLDPKTRLLTLTGTAGIGKTRLALQVASALVEHFEDGVYFVDLTAVLDPEAVLPAVAHTLGLGEEQGRPAETTLLDYIRERRMLLVLDNFEQVLDAASSLIRLMQASPWIKVLVTSREALHVRGERRFPVPSLAAPDLAQLPSMEALGRYPSVELFVERAQSVAPDFMLDANNAGDVAALCVGLDGLPIAIELAAAHANHLSPAEMRRGMANLLDLLTGGGRDLPAKQRTIRGAIGWSYNLLSSEEQQLFRCLGVFVGGFTSEAVAAIYGQTPDPPFTAADYLLSLTDKHLVREERQSFSPNARVATPRFSLLEAIREYSLEKLEVAEETTEAKRRHALYYLSVAEKANSHFNGPQDLNWGVEQTEWVDKLDSDLDNMRAALNWYQDQAELEKDEGAGSLDNLLQGLQLTTALTRVWFGRGHFSEGLQRTMALLAMVPKPLPTEPLRLSALYAAALIVVGRLAPLQSSDISEVRALVEESIGVASRLGDKQMQARGLLVLGSVDQSQGDHKRANAQGTKSLGLFRELGNKWGTAAALQDLGEIELGQGNFISARVLLEESRALYLEVGEQFGAASAQASLGYAAYCVGDYQRAHLLLSESVEMSRKIGYGRVERYAKVILGWVLAREGLHEEARKQLSDEVIRAREPGLVFPLYWSLVGLGALEALQGTERETKQAAVLLGAADALRADRRIQISPVYQAELDAAVAGAQARLSEEDWDAAWAKGRAMPPEEAVLDVFKYRPSIYRASRGKSQVGRGK